MEIAIRPINIRRASKLVAERLRERILYGDLRNETRLAPEADLADQLGISRHHLREALRLLEQDGLIEVKRGHTGGVFLTTPRADVLSRTTEGILARNQVLVSDVLEAGIVLSIACARIATKMATDEELHSLEQELDTLTNLDMVEGLSKFRVTIARLSRNQTLYLLTLSLDPIRIHATRAFQVPWAAEHRQALHSIVSAMISRDPDLVAKRYERYMLGATTGWVELGFAPEKHTITDSIVLRELDASRNRGAS